MQVIKKIIFTLFSLFIFTNLNAQEIQSKSQKVDSLFFYVKKNIPFEKNVCHEITDVELEKIKKFLYESYAYAPIEFDKKLNKWYKEWEATGIKGVSPPVGLKPSKRLHLLKEKIADKYGWEYVRYLETPYFMKVKITDIKPSSYKIDKRGIRTAKIDLKVEILEVLKGGKFYSIGDVITVSYLPIWFQKTKSPNFELNEIYAFPLRHWSEIGNTGYFNQKTELLLNLHGQHSFYKIKNENVTTPLIFEDNFSCPWNDFKKSFKQKYVIEN